MSVNITVVCARPSSFRPSLPYTIKMGVCGGEMRGNIRANVKDYIGGFFRAHLKFPEEYPLRPPEMKFESPIFHPNSPSPPPGPHPSFISPPPTTNKKKTKVYPSGEVCISILHPPEDDAYGYESASERWSPVQTPETILLSVISMLSSPNDESPANVEAARMWREDERGFRRRVGKDVRASLGD